MAAVKNMLIEYAEQRERNARASGDAFHLAICEIALQGEPNPQTLGMLNAWDAHDIRADFLTEGGAWDDCAAWDTLAEHLDDEQVSA